MLKSHFCNSRVILPWALTGLGGAILFLGGCGNPSLRSSSAAPPLQGMVHGGQQPVVGANIALYVAGATGYGSAASPLLTATVMSGAGGSFSITNDYMCPSGSSQVYVVATGGDSGAGTNSSLALMAALGSCGNLGPSTFINVNELTTAAAVYALAPFMAVNSGTPGGSLGASSTNSQGLTQAFATANNLVNIATGSSPGASLPSGATAPTSELNTLADILATCVNSNGGTGECSTLFTDATPIAGSAPANTIDAMLDIALNPSNNVSALNNLVTGTPPFQPTLGSAPNDWTLAINYTDATLNGPGPVAVDGSGNIWVANTAGNTITEFSNAGSVLSGASGYTGGGISSPQDITIDLLGFVWLANSNNSISKFSSSGVASSGSSGYTGIGVNSPKNIVILPSAGNIMISNNAAGSVSRFTQTTGALAGTTTNGGLSNPFGLAANPANDVWITNGNNTLSEILGGTGAAVGTTPFSGGGLNSPEGVAVDASGNVWVANHNGASLSKFNSSGTAITSSSGYTGGGLTDPYRIAVDGSGKVWVTNPTGSCLSEFSSSGTAISGSSGYAGAGLNSPQGLAIDGSGNIWIPNSSTNKLTEFVGAAAPVTTPLGTATKNSKLGARP